MAVVRPLSPSELRPLFLPDWRDSGPTSSDDAYNAKNIKWKLSRRKVGQTWRRYRQDHPRAFKYREAVPAKPFRFFDLPFELRRIILSYQLKQRKPVLQIPPNFKGEDKGFLPVDTRIFAVSKRVREEADTVFYAENIFRLNVCGYEDWELPLWITSPPVGARAMRSVDLCIQPCYDDSGFTALLRQLPQITRVLKQCRNLERLRILPHTFVETFSSNDEDRDLAIDCLKDFSNIGEVVVSERTGIHRLVSFTELLSGDYKPKIRRRPDKGS